MKIGWLPGDGHEGIRMPLDASTVYSARSDFVEGSAFSGWKSSVRSGMPLGYSGLHMLESAKAILLS
jgi:hypothetical protein